MSNYSKLDLAIMKKMMATIDDAKKKIERLDAKSSKLDDYYRQRAEERKYTIQLERESAVSTIELYVKNLNEKFGKSTREIRMILSADEPDLFNQPAGDLEPDEINEQEEDEAEDEMAVEETVPAPSTEEFTKPDMEMEAPATEEEAFDPFEHLDDDEYVPSTSEPTENDLPEEVDRDEELGF